MLVWHPACCVQTSYSCPNSFAGLLYSLYSSDCAHELSRYNRIEAPEDRAWETKYIDFMNAPSCNYKPYVELKKLRCAFNRLIKYNYSQRNKCMYHHVTRADTLAFFTKYLRLYICLLHFVVTYFPINIVPPAFCLLSFQQLKTSTPHLLHPPYMSEHRKQLHQVLPEQ